MLAGVFIASVLRKQVSGVLTSTGSGHSVYSYFCRHGASVSHGDGGRLGPGGLLSPCPQAQAGTSGLQRFQTVTSSPGVISLLATG